MWFGVLVLAILVAAFPIYRTVDQHRRSAALASQERALVTSGAHLWQLNCAACHGAHGQGVSAPALNSKEFLGSVTDVQIQRIMSVGISGTAMPAWSDEFSGPLTEQQIASVVAYLRSLEHTAPSVPDWRSRFVG
jgi:mono/diheme cytochrome c family protein